MSRVKISALNDAFRNTFEGGQLIITASVSALPPVLVSEALQRVRTFNGFTPDNDPHGEHDFGSFEVAKPQVLMEDRLLRQVHDMEFGRSRRSGAHHSSVDRHACRRLLNRHIGRFLREAATFLTKIARARSYPHAFVLQSFKG
jgi:hypothetical protein